MDYLKALADAVRAEMAMEKKSIGISREISREVNMEKFRNRKTGELVDACRWDDDAIVSGVIQYTDLPAMTCRGCGEWAHYHGLINTLDDGIMVVHPGEWVVRDSKGELWPWEADLFRRVFERVNDAP